MSALILMMLKDDTDALEEEIADIFKLLNLPEHRHIAVSPHNRARLKALLRDRLIKLAEQKQKRLKRYMKKWGRKKNISREKMIKITNFILSAEFMAFYIAEGCLDFVLQASIEDASKRRLCGCRKTLHPAGAIFISPKVWLT